MKEIMRVTWALWWKASLIGIVGGFLAGLVIGFLVGFSMSIMGYTTTDIQSAVKIPAMLAGLLVSYFGFTWVVWFSLGKDIGGKKIAIVSVSDGGENAAA